MFSYQGRQNVAFIGDDGHTTNDFQRAKTGDDGKVNKY